MGAFKGFDMAQFNLGAFYYDGIYVTQFNTKAREWFNRAATQGLEDAINYLKIMDEAETVSEEKKAEDKKKAATEEKAEEKA